MPAQSENGTTTAPMLKHFGMEADLCIWLQYHTGEIMLVVCADFLTVVSELMKIATCCYWSLGE